MVWEVDLGLGTSFLEFWILGPGDKYPNHEQGIAIQVSDFSYQVLCTGLRILGFGYESTYTRFGYWGITSIVWDSGTRRQGKYMYHVWNARYWVSGTRLRVPGFIFQA